MRQGGHHVGHWPTFLVTFVTHSDARRYAVYDPIQGQGQGDECLKATRGVDRQSQTGLIFKSRPLLAV